jgi:hypothetical protein
MTAIRIQANCNLASSFWTRAAANLQFSNRKLLLLESHSSHCKQTTAFVSNRNFLRGRLFGPAPAIEIWIPHRVGAAHWFAKKEGL